LLRKTPFIRRKSAKIGENRDRNIVPRYVFIFCLKNPGKVDDDFWNFVISGWIVAFSGILNFVVYRSVFLIRRVH
jgi:hypothetical protein